MSKYENGQVRRERELRRIQWRKLASVISNGLAIVSRKNLRVKV
jgi:hypothetical protein